MNFIFTLTAAIICFALGISISCFALIIIDAVTKRKQKSYRLSLALVMISISIAVASCAIIIISKNQDENILSIKKYFSFSTKDILYYSSIFLAGILCGVLPKIFFPLTIGLYAALSVFTTVAIYKKIGIETDSVTVTVSEDKIKIDGEQYQFLSLPNQKNVIIFSVSTLPDKLLVPLPRIWYFQNSIAEKNSTGATEKAIGTAPLSESSKKTFMSLFYSYLFLNQKNAEVELPFSQFYPAIYTIKSERTLTKINFTAERSF